ncbi:PAS domain S-box protein [Pseudalkalibacillus sp. Hm43]|uniref:PAS domain S-box protein n=1 Tax=Pseudalkalibacillus sp. Hm43 TaxID=3450742 RepID=UPI003F41D94B
MRSVSRVPMKTIDPEDMYRQIVEYTYETTVIHADLRVLYINQFGADFLKAPKDEIIGANVLDIFREGHDQELIEDRIRLNQEENIIGELIDIQIFKCDGTLVDVELYCHPVMFGEQFAIHSTLRDITSRKKAEKQLEKISTEVVEISSPIVPVSEGIAIIPLIGYFDQEKVDHLLDFIPHKLAKHQLKYLIIDFSGIYQMNKDVVAFLFKINSILRLLGIYPVLTGIRPELAHKAVQLGEDMSKIRTIRNVKEALSQLRV